MKQVFAGSASMVLAIAFVIVPLLAAASEEASDEHKPTYTATFNDLDNMCGLMCTCGVLHLFNREVDVNSLLEQRPQILGETTLEDVAILLEKSGLHVQPLVDVHHWTNLLIKGTVAVLQVKRQNDTTPNHFVILRGSRNSGDPFIADPAKKECWISNEQLTRIFPGTALVVYDEAAAPEVQRFLGTLNAARTRKYAFGIAAALFLCAAGLSALHGRRRTKCACASGDRTC